MEETMIPNRLLFEIDVLRPRWGWLLFLGILMTTFGTIALFIAPAATIGTALVAGWLLVFSGIIEMVHAFRVRLWGGLFLHLIGGVLGLLVGLLVVTHPLAGAVAWTLLFASFLSVVGLFRMIAAIRLKFPYWGWAVFDGIVSLGLGILLWVDWPWSGLWFLGVSVGISLVLRGWSYVMFAIALRNWSVPVEVRRAA
jgi:uncharacterized membrane protein HdeD (DUF308 family)